MSPNVKLAQQKLNEAARLRFRRWATQGPWSPGLFQAFAPEFPIVDRESLVAQGYSSQLGQDLFLDQFLFREKREGVFLDIGAHDGRTYSNSLFFEVQRGWNGVCVEPNPAVFHSLVINRRTPCVQAAVCDASSAEVDFLAPSSPDIDMLAGLKDTYGRRHLRRLEQESAASNSHVRTIKVPSVTLMDLCHTFAIRQVDVLMIDVEGAELQVLASADWSMFRPRAILLESNYGSRAPIAFLRKRGYQLLARIGWDRVFVPTDFWR